MTCVQTPHATHRRKSDADAVKASKVKVITKKQEKKLYAAVSAAEAFDDDDAKLLSIGGGLDDDVENRTLAAFRVGENMDFNLNTPDDADYDDL